MGKKKVRRAYFLGETKEKLAKIFEGVTEIQIVDDLKEAVMLAKKEAKWGETVLFSPACASFDMFKDYAERGDKFVHYVG